MGTRTESGVSHEGLSAPSGEPTSEPTSEPVERLADEIERRGIGAAAAILLDAHRPLLPLLRQGAIFLGPLVGPILGSRRHAILRRAVEDPGAYERLTARLAEHRSEGRR